MPEPQIVPPPPTINQGADLSDAQAMDAVQRAFDRVAPEVKGSPTPPKQAPEPTPPVVEKPQEREPEKPVQPAETKPAEEPKTEPEPHKIPSFIERALQVEPESPTTQAPDELPEELPEFKTPEERKERWRNFRTAYENVKRERDQLKSRPSLDEPTRIELETLRNNNKEMKDRLDLYSVETHQEFQNNVLRPMHMAWEAAARIVKEAGGDPVALQKAMALSGKSQYEALDELFQEIPASARDEAMVHLANFRRFNQARMEALANAPKTMENLRKADMDRQNKFLQKQRSDMASMYDEAVRKLRDEAKVELLMTSTDPDAKWWNERATALENTGRQLFLDNREMERVAMCCALAPMVDVYRKMFLEERALRLKNDKIIKERFGSEPSISDGAGGAPPATMQDDLKRPFSEVFLREFHKQRASGVQ